MEVIYSKMKNIHCVVALLIIATGSECYTKRCTFIDFRGRNDTDIDDNIDDSMTECPQHEVCRRTINISYIDMPPYSNGILFNKIVQGCCGVQCTKFNTVNRFTNISQVKLLHTHNSDFILPFLGSSSAEHLYGYHFIPFANAPHAYYITLAHAPPIARMLKNCAGMHALILLCLLTAIISGLIIWTFETLFQEESERQPFLRGVFEGFWWSLTVVTPGYGAKVVQSIPAKVYSIIWVLVGVVIFSLMTSAFTAELMSVMGQHYDSMAGARVGVLKYRDYDASIVVREGGVVQESGAPDFHHDLRSLVRMLRKKEIDGVLLDKYTMAYAKRYLTSKLDTMTERTNAEQVSQEGSDKHMHETDEFKRDIDCFFTNTDSTLKEYTGEKLSYGVLVKRKVDFDFLNGAVRDNRLSSETAVESEMNQIFPRKKQEVVIDPSHSIPFWNVIWWITVVLACTFLCGIGYESYQRCHGNNKTETMQDDPVNCLIHIVKDQRNKKFSIQKDF